MGKKKLNRQVESLKQELAFITANNIEITPLMVIREKSDFDESINMSEINYRRGQLSILYGIREMIDGGREVGFNHVQDKIVDIEKEIDELAGITEVEEIKEEEILHVVTVDERELKDVTDGSEEEISKASDSEGIKDYFKTEEL